MLKTKAFAELCDTSKKTIIHYDRIGLLKPYKREGIFRYYQPKQVLIFQKIALLKYFGLTLEEIKKYLNKDHELFDLFVERKKILQIQKQIIEKKINKADEYIINFKTGNKLIIPKIKIIQPYSIYALEKTARYVDINEHQKELYRLIGDKNYESVGITLFKEEGYLPEKAQMITGAIIKGKPKHFKGIKVLNFPEYKAVTYTHIGPYSFLSFVWQFLNQYVKDNNLKLNPKVYERELYILGSLYSGSEDNFITELHIPIL